MEDDLNFKLVDIVEDGMISIDDTTGLPTETGGLVKPPKQPDKEEIKKEEDLIEIPDKVETKDTKEEKDTPDSKETKTPSSDSVYKVLIEALHEKGVLSSDINFDEINKAINEEGEDPANILFALMQNELDEQVNFYKNRLPDKIKSLIEHYEDGVPLDEIIKIKSEQQRLDNIPEKVIREDANLQKEIIRKYMTEKGESETRINRHIKRLEELEELEEDAIDAHSGLVEIYKRKEQSAKEKALEEEEKREKKRIEILDQIKDNITQTREIIPNISLTDRDKQVIIDSMTKPVGVDDNGNPISAVQKTRMINPIEFEKALHYYHMIGLFNFDSKGKFTPDFSKLDKTIKSKAVEDLSNKLRGEEQLGGGSAAVREKKNTEDRMQSIQRFLGK